MANERQLKVGADFNKQQLLQAVLENISVSTVASPVKGQIVYNIVADATYDSNKVYYYNGTEWVNISEDKMTFESSDSSITITIPGTGADVNIKVNPRNILHSRLNNDQQTGNPHRVSLTELIAHDAGGRKLTGGESATDATDFVIKSQLDAISAGLEWGDSVKSATIANIDLATIGINPVDTFILTADDRVLVKDQTTKTENGIYVVTAATWVRAIDADETTELNKFTCSIDEGTINKGSAWTQTTHNPVIGTSDIIFSKVSEALTYSAGNGISITGTIISAKPETGKGIAVGGGGITVEASDLAGVGLEVNITKAHELDVQVDDSTIEIARNTLQVKDNGITGPKINSSAIGIGLEKESVTVDKKIQVKPYNPPTLKIIAPKVDANGIGIPIDGDTIKANPTGELYVDTTVITSIKKYASPLMTPMTVGTHTITHNLGTRDVIVTVYESDANPVEVFIAVNGDNSLDVTTNVEIVRAKVVIIG